MIHQLQHGLLCTPPVLQLHRKAPLQGQQEQDRWIRNRVGMCSKRRAMIDVSANVTGHAWMHMCGLVGTSDNNWLGDGEVTSESDWHLTGIDQIGIGKWQLQVWFGFSSMCGNTAKQPAQLHPMSRGTKVLSNLGSNLSSHPSAVAHEEGGATGEGGGGFCHSTVTFQFIITPNTGLRYIWPISLTAAPRNHPGHPQAS